MNKEPKFYRAILEDERARRASTAGGGGTDYGCDIEVLSFPQANCAQILKEYSKKRDDFGNRSQMCVVYVKEHFHMYILKNGYMLTYLGYIGGCSHFGVQHSRHHVFSDISPVL